MQFRVLECKRFTAPQSSNYAVHTRLVKDFEIDIELSNGREYSIGDKSYHIKRGDMCIRFPGQVLKAKGWQDSYILTLDFSQKVNPEGYTRNTVGEIQQLIPYDFINSLPNVISFDQVVTLKNIYENIVSYADKNDPNVKILVEELLYTCHLVFHPFDGFWDLKHEKRGSVRASIVFIVVTILAFYYQSIGQGYLLNPTGEYSSPLRRVGAGVALANGTTNM